MLVFMIRKWLSSLSVFLFSLSVILLLSLWSYRWIFYHQFSYTYMRDWYDHSQWQIPLSPRIMGDAELYQLSAYHLLQGDSPFHINPETPPAGKYLYGVSILLKNNPYYASLFYYFTALTLFFILTTLVFDEKRKRYMATLLFALSPVFFSQIGQVGLDLPQVCFLLLHIIFLFVLAKPNVTAVGKIIFAVMSGIGLGLFTGAKIGVFSPIIFLVGAWYLWQKKRVHELLIIMCTAPLTYAAAYLPYFVAGHNIIDWLKAQKWVVNFYFVSQIKSIPFMAVMTLFSGVYMGWWDSIVYVREWTILWPLSVVMLLLLLSRRFWKNTKITLEWKYLLFLSIGLLTLNCFIPFWPRYLMMILPFTLLIITQFLEKKREKWLYGVLFFSLLHFVMYLFPLPNETLKMVQQTWESGSYQELYSFTDEHTHQSISREDFANQLRMIDYQLEVTQREIPVSQFVFIPPWQNEVTQEVRVNYRTPIGYLYHPMKLTLVREHNKWRAIWKWENVLPSYAQGDTVLMVKDAVRSGDLRSADNVILSQDETWPYIFVTPDKVGESETLINDLVTLTRQDGPVLRYKLFVLSPSHVPVPIGFVLPYYDPSILERTQFNRAVMMEQLTTRVYNKAFRDESIFKDVQQMEKDHPEIHAIQGGRILVRKSSGEEVVIHTAISRNGENTYLPKTFEEIFGKTHTVMLKEAASKISY